MGTTKETFREVIGHFASGVTVITARSGGEDHGATASAVSSLSLDPPMLLVCLNTRSVTQEAVRNSRAFGVNILDEDQGVLAQRFAMPHGGDKFAGVNVERGETGVPLLAGALAFCECRVAEDVAAGTHRVFLAEVTRAVAREGAPLTYFRGEFGRFEVPQDRAVYTELRSRVLNRTFALSHSLDLVSLAEELGALPSTVYHAMTKLMADGLVAADPERGYVVKPITVAVSDEALDARCAIELGVAALTVGRVGDDEIRELRELMEQTLPLVAGGHFVDVETYSKLNAEFHTAVAALAKNPTLLDAYERLSVPGLMVSFLTPASEVDEEVVEDHRELVEAFEQQDIERAQRVIATHTEHAKEVCRRAIEQVGGQL